MKKQRIKSCLFLLLFFTCILSAQTDSLVLQANELGFQDVLTNENLFDNQKIVSASRSLKEISDLPFTIHIITKKEILENGYTTLVDVLKMAPGIRTSQPGSASEGETFNAWSQRKCLYKNINQWCTCKTYLYCFNAYWGTIANSSSRKN